jgi:preprotein translocase subunit SecD
MGRVIPLALALALALAAACKKQPRRGGGSADIQRDRSRPGVELVFTSADGSGRSRFDEVIKVLRQRLKRAGLVEAKVTQDARGIVIKLPGLAPADLDRVRRIIGSTGGLEFALAHDDEAYAVTLAGQVERDGDAAVPGVSAGSDSVAPADGPARVEYFVHAAERAPLERYLAAFASMLPPAPDRRLVLEQIAATPVAPAFWRSHLIGPAELDNADLRSAEVIIDHQFDRPQVSLVFSAEGGARFEALTRAHVGDKLAIVIDGEVNSTPVIQSAIPGGRAVITMGGSDVEKMGRESSDLVNLLRSQPLAFRLVEVTP